MRPPACAVKFELSSIFRSGRKHPSVMMVRCKHQLWPPPFGYNFIQKKRFVESFDSANPPMESETTSGAFYWQQASCMSIKN